MMVGVFVFLLLLKGGLGETEKIVVATGQSCS
jgi:hypothetical protein